MQYKAIVHTMFLGAAVLIGAVASAQPTPNKPNNKTQVDPAPGTFNLELPGQYPADVKINYVRVREARWKYTSDQQLDEAAQVTGGYNNVQEFTSYSDGLGRKLQQVIRRFTPGTDPKDLVQPTIYDDFARETLIYSPYAATENNGSFKLDPFHEQRTFMLSLFPGEEVSYGKNVFQASPLTRTQKTFAAGNSWTGSEGSTQEKMLRQHYMVNTADDAVRVWRVTNNSLLYDGDETAINIPTSTAVYDAGKLYKNVIVDEEGNVEVEYKNMEGRVVLEKVQIGNIAADYSGYTGFLCTYYVYDDFNQLRFVIPPKAVAQLQTVNWQLQQDVTSELCFRYEYDHRNRVIGKKLPGAGWNYMIYDKRDRPVFAQDANMRTRDQWMVTLYDELNRNVLTGIVVYNGGFAGLQSWVNANTGYGEISTQDYGVPGPYDLYVDQRIPAPFTLYVARNTVNFTGEFTSEAGAEIVAEIDPAFNLNTSLIEVLDNPIPGGTPLIALTLTFYDAYPTNKTYNASYNNNLDPGKNPNSETMPSQATTLTKGLVTEVRARVIEDPNDLTKGIWLSTTNFFDEKARLLQVQNDNYRGGTDITTRLYDFSGKTLSWYTVHKNPATGKQVSVRTNVEYDHGGRVLEIWKSINNATNQILVVKNEYNELGQLVKKELGRKKDASGNYTSSAVETLEFTYNLRGWLNGINRDYARGTTSNRWFGLELNYDWGFGKSYYDGNVAGTKWRSKGDDERRAYGFSYDKSNRIMGSDFSQYDGNGNAYVDNGVINFDMMMGDGLDPSLAYDQNGNIKAMKQWGLKLAASTEIDDLTYEYHPNSNKLLSVTESTLIAGTDHKLGDFTDRHRNQSPLADYDYDANGNTILDLNKRLYGFYNIDGAYSPGIIYNHLNLPWQVTAHPASGDGTITFIYDAVGNKLEKRLHEDPSSEIGMQEKDTKTTYIGEFVYENDQLQFFSHEEGRVRVLPANSGTDPAWAFDYFVKDHLGDVRMVLTEETQTDIYQAGLETANRSFEVALFGDKINTTEHPKPTGFDTDDDNDKVSMLTGSVADKRLGPGVILKVMAGDKIKAKTFAWYLPNSDYTTDNTLQHIMVNILSQLVPGVSTLGKGTAAQNITNNLLQPGMQDLLNEQLNAPGRPRAYLNWILFDEQQFERVAGNYGSVQVPVITDPETQKQLLQANNGDVIEMKKNGYLYVYISNESKANVHFDDIRVEHIRGSLMEETHYYPFGLTMTGISSKALNTNYVANKKKFQRQEFNTDLGVDWYEYKYRNHDPQIGRFMQIDPLAEKFAYNSPYAFSENKVTGHVELEGLEAYPMGMFYMMRYWEYIHPRGEDFNGRITEGMISSPFIEQKQIAKLEKGPIEEVKGIILHRTVSSTAGSTLNSFSSRGVGTHFLVGPNGKIYQTASLDQKTSHLRESQLLVDDLANANTIGIEVVGNYNPTTKQWDPLTTDQAKAVAFLVNSLVRTYGLTNNDIYNHEHIQPKTEGEGNTVYNAIRGYLNMANNAMRTPIVSGATQNRNARNMNRNVTPASGVAPSQGVSAPTPTPASAPTPAPRMRPFG